MPGGSQTAVADLVVVGGHRVAGQVQAKLYESVSGTAHEVAHEHYAGMGRLVASDRVDGVGSLLQRRVAMNPESPLLPRYRDAAAHLGDRVEVGGVRSRPISLEQARRAAGDPVRWAAHQVAVSAARQVGVAAATGAGLAALVEMVSVIVVSRAADVPVSAALASSGAAVASTGARAGSTAVLGEGLRLAATLGALPRVLAVGTLPVAVAASLVEIAGHGVDLAGGRSTAGELASASAATVARSGVVWAFTVAGQAAVPVPVVGALAGAVVGQGTAHALGRGLALGLDAVRDHGGASGRSGEEIRQSATAVEPADVERADVDPLGGGPWRAARPGCGARRCAG